MKAIEIENLQYKIGNARILKNVSFEVNKGEIYGLIGHNGAGKTTLLRTLLGLATHYQGNIKLFESSNLSGERVKIGAVMDCLGVDEKLSAKKYLHRVCYMLGDAGEAHEKELLEKVGLGDVGKKPINKFSLGMKRRLLIACALAGKPELLILDEPFNGIDPQGMGELRLLLQRLVSEGITILITSHIIPELIKLSTRFGVMHEGEFIADFTQEQLADASVKKTVFKTKNPLGLIEGVKQMWPHLFCVSDAVGEVSVLGKASEKEWTEICSSVSFENVNFNVPAGEEDILLWKMNGFRE